MSDKMIFCLVIRCDFYLRSALRFAFYAKDYFCLFILRRNGCNIFLFFLHTFEIDKNRKEVQFCWWISEVARNVPRHLKSVIKVVENSLFHVLVFEREYFVLNLSWQTIRSISGQFFKKNWTPFFFIYTLDTFFSDLSNVYLPKINWLAVQYRVKIISQKNILPANILLV